MWSVPGREDLQAALKEADDEGVPRHGGAAEVGESGREVLTCLGTERLARTKPDQRVTGEPLAQRVEARPQRVTRAERARIERFAIDEDAPPLAVPPELELRDRNVRLMALEPAESALEARRAEGRVQAAETAIEVRPELPREPEGSGLSRALGRVVHEELQGLLHVPRITAYRRR